uniref:Secreted protein n=1 Tax=Panagrellus redivivus TaxID=6233 RepID=A0A7E4UTF0_PANRE
MFCAYCRCQPCRTQSSNFPMVKLAVTVDLAMLILTRQLQSAELVVGDPHYKYDPGFIVISLEDDNDGNDCLLLTPLDSKVTGLV